MDVYNASVNPESSPDGKFTLTLDPNPTAMERKAVVIVSDPCGNSSTFIFTQGFDPALCDETVSVSDIASYSGTSLCSDGAAYLHLTGDIGANDPDDYIWTLGGEEEARGLTCTASKTGKYIVYYKAIGCSNQSADFNVTASPNTAPNPVQILINSNNGFVCEGDGKTTLIAQTNGTGTIR